MQPLATVFDNDISFELALLEIHVCNFAVNKIFKKYQPMVSSSHSNYMKQSSKELFDTEPWIALIRWSDWLSHGAEWLTVTFLSHLLVCPGNSSHNWLAQPVTSACLNGSISSSAKKHYSVYSFEVSCGIVPWTNLLSEQVNISFWVFTSFQEFGMVRDWLKTNKITEEGIQSCCSLDNLLTWFHYLNHGSHLAVCTW